MQMQLINWTWNTLFILEVRFITIKFRNYDLLDIFNLTLNFHIVGAVCNLNFCVLSVFK